VDVAVTDSLMPFVPALMAWGHNEQVMTGFVDELAGLLRPVHPVIVYFGLELAGDREAREPAGEEAVWMLDFCVREGLLLAKGGYLYNQARRHCQAS